MLKKKKCNHKFDAAYFVAITCICSKNEQYLCEATVGPINCMQRVCSKCS